MDIKILEFGYSVEYKKHMMRFNIRGMEKEMKDKMLPVLSNVPLGDIKRFKIERDDENGLKILEFFPENEYPFNKEVPSDEEIKAVEKMVKGFIAR